MSLDFRLVDVCEKCGNTKDHFTRKLNDNLIKMARVAGVYECLWCPDEHGYNTAEDILSVLRWGINKLQDNPEHFKLFNPESGWGDYEGLMEFAIKVYDACLAHPHAKIRVCR